MATPTGTWQFAWTVPLPPPGLATTFTVNMGTLRLGGWRFTPAVTP